MKRIKYLCSLGLLALMTLGCMVNPRVEVKRQATGEVAPNLEGRDADDQPLRLADLKGQVVLIDFWQSL